MDWFKHSTGSHHDPDFSDAWDEFGDAAPAVFWTILEMYGIEFSSLKDGWMTVSVKYFERELRRKWKKIEKILEFYQSRGRIQFQKTEKTVSIKIPKFLEISSNWTRKKTLLPTEAPTEMPTEAPPPIEVEKKKNKKRNIKKEGRDFVFVLPEEIDQKVWDAFVEMRKSIKKPLTEYAKHLICLDLGKLDGDKNEILNQSIKKSWQGVFPLDDTRKTPSPSDALSDLNRYLEESR